MKPVFLPVDSMGRPTAEGEEAVPSNANRRKFKRHRYTQAVQMHLAKPGSRDNPYQAMSFEISLGGMSAATPNVLFMGERLELYPVMGFRVKAVVRRKNGAMYGFEFVDLDEQQQAKIGKTCEGLPEFQSMIDV
jgi:c-di-GMP-binding flagellar brake protein YcgR